MTATTRSFSACAVFAAVVAVSTSPSACWALQSALTPVIGISPPSLDFGCIEVGSSLNVTLDIYNETDDPSSILHVTSLIPSGPPFAIVEAPPLPIWLPGDGSVARVTVRFSPMEEGEAEGTIVVTASNAINSPRIVDLVGATCSGQMVQGEFVIGFTPDALDEGAPLQGALDQYQFRYPHLRMALIRANVIRLERLMPWFTRDQVHSINQFGEEITLFDLSTIYLAKLGDASANPAFAVANVAGQAGVAFAHGSRLGEPDFQPNDQQFYAQWGLHNTGDTSVFGDSIKTGIDVNAPEAWERLQGGTRATTIALLDSGVLPTHPDRARVVVQDTCMYDCGSPSTMWHGTATSGIAAAAGNNGIGVAGAAWNVSIAAIRIGTEHSGGGVEFSRTATTAGISYAANKGYEVISLSVSWPEDRDFPEAMAVNNAVTMGSLFVCSMGNRGLHEPPETEASPPRLAASMAVGAVWCDGLRWDDTRIPQYSGIQLASSIGSWIDIAAPGGRAIATTRNDGGYFKPSDPPNPNDLNWGFGGTSASAPLVAGVAALLKSYRVDLDSDDLRQVLQRSARDVEIYGIKHDAHTGWGIVDISAAMDSVSLPSRSVQHYQVPPPINDSMLTQIEFKNLQPFGYPVPDGEYQCMRYRLDVSSGFYEPFAAAPSVWYRRSGTRGWRKVGYQVGFELFDLYVESHAAAEVIWSAPTYATTTTYVYRVLSGSGQHIAWVPVQPSAARIAFTAMGPVNPVGVADEPASVRLSSVKVLPNPAAPQTTFLVQLHASGEAALNVYDVTGRHVRSLLKQRLATGIHRILWDGRDGQGHEVVSGMYFYALELDGRQLAKNKLLVVH